MSGDIFWSTFYTKPARVPLETEPFDYDKETHLLKKVCAELIDMPVPAIESHVRDIQHVTEEFALESPLTPSTSMFHAIESGAVGETFKHNRFRICKCHKCRVPSTSDWMKGPCGDRVVEKEPYSFVHVNLSRRVGSIDAFVKLVEPVFIRKRKLFRMLHGDSDLTLVMLASDREHEKEIRRILREKRFRIDKGIRIFEITKDLLGNDKRQTPPPSDSIN